jgi:hypothetical protein
MAVTLLLDSSAVVRYYAFSGQAIAGPSVADPTAANSPKMLLAVPARSLVEGCTLLQLLRKQVKWTIRNA